MRSLIAIHSSLITDRAVERRPALALTARRAGYILCNIRLDRIPKDGEITLIKDGVERASADVRREFQRYLPLSRLTAERRGWTALTLDVLRGLQTTDFTLSDVYAHEKIFTSAYPSNRHVREKIRQQLQTLRDIGVLEFRGNGRYSVKK